MSVRVIIELSDEEAAYLAQLAQDGGMGIGQLCTSIIALTVLDDRAAERPKDATA